MKNLKSLALLAATLVASVSAQTTPAVECQNLVKLLQDWRYPEANIPADARTNCCSWSPVIACTPNGRNDLTVSTLNLANSGISGETPVSLALLQDIQTLDISNNPGIVGDLRIISQIPALRTIRATGNTGLAGRVPGFPNSVTTCDFAGTGLCGEPGNCQRAASAQLPTTCAADNVAKTGPTENFVPKGIPLYVGLGFIGVATLLFALICISCSQRGSVAKAQLAKLGSGSTSLSRSLSRSKSQDAPLPSDAEMSLITLSRNGPPRRTFSLPDERKNATPEAAALDVAAREPFMAANTPPGSEEFHVRRPYEKQLPDEMHLQEGDRVVLTRVFRDGWAEGVSLRCGGPAVFPLACLGGGVPVVLAERLQAARMANWQRMNAQMPQPGPGGMMPPPPPMQMQQMSPQGGAYPPPPPHMVQQGGQPMYGDM
ncbi:hypothetical protein HDV05_002777, partial [Chytridiales sp. JEL 0842]